MRIAIFGGSFDPVHNGHLSLAENALKLARLDKIIFVPAGRQVHKIKIHASKKDRCRMVELAVKGRKKFSISEYELLKKSPAYSYETIRYFRRKYPSDGIFFLIGSDSLTGLPKWKSGWKLLDLCTFIVGRRSTLGMVGIKPALKKKMKFIKTPVVSVSSSEIRDKIKTSRSVKGMLPETVRKYIKKNGLYKK